jgi:anthranilate synthase component 1
MNPQTSISEFIQASKEFRTIPVLQHFFVDTITPIQIMQQLCKEAVYILESNDMASPWAKYSFIGLTPKYKLIEKKNRFFVLDENGTVLFEKSSFQETFDTLKQYLNPKLLREELPFSAGGVGFMAYDAVSQLERIPEHPKANEEEEKYHFVFCETIIAYDHHKKVLKVIQQVQLNGYETLEQLEDLYLNALQKGNQLFQKCTQSTQSPLPITLHHEEPVEFDNISSNYSKAGFVEDVNKIKQYIKNGDIFQAVLSQRWEIDVSVTGFELYRILRVVNPSPYLFYLKLDDIEIVGSSPERLVEVCHGEVEIHPIAGTRRRGENSTEDEQLAKDLLNDEKELAEHYMLVDLARNDVGRVAKYGSVHTPVLVEVSKFSHVMHLISKVRGKLAEGRTPIDAMVASFPAGTVSGAPKIRAMEIIHELEPTPRGIYAGAIGYLGFDGNIDSCIAIRTMVIRNQKVYIQAGAGIVWDSIPVNEWEETQNKARALMHTIKIAEKTFQKQEVNHV